MSGSKNCPETPRQKMIGMMYLFLTAMLALNVSSEVLNGFVLVNNSLLQSITSTDTRNENIYKRFRDLKQDNPGKIGEWLDKALVVKKKSDEIFNYVENFKYQLVRLADGKDAVTNDIKNKDNLDVSGQYALVQGNGKILRKKIAEYKKFLESFVNGDPVKISMFERNFSTKGGKDGKDWQETVFEMMPVAAATTILTKYQTDIRAAEGEVVQYLMAQTDAGDFRVNKLQAYVIPVSTYVMQGDRYTATIVLSAIDSTKTPQIVANGRTLGKDGKFEMICNQVGTFKYGGSILLNSGGVNKKYDFASEYTVGAKSASVTNSALNVVYAGIQNHMAVSVPGVPAANVMLTCSEASVRRMPNGLWECIPSRSLAGRQLRFSIQAKTESSKGYVQMGGGVFVVRRLPDPIPMLSIDGVAKKSAQVSPGKLGGATLIADYENELISAKFTITGFALDYPNGEVIATNGSSLSGQQKARLAKEKFGARIIIRDIKAMGPDGPHNELPPIFIKLN